MSAVLAIDTAAPRLQLALLLADGRVEALVEDMPTGQAERLFPALGELLARAGLGYADLGRVVVTTGPGSFTGLRIGLSAARGLGLALGIPVLGIPSLLALSLVAPSGAPLTVALDARRGEDYVQHFVAPGVEEGPAELLPQHGWTARGAVLSAPHVDVAALARFGAAADPTAWPPEAAYIRSADAKPQERFRVARVHR